MQAKRSNQRTENTTNLSTIALSGSGPVGWFLNLFSSIWLGVFLMLMLFIYGSIGSAGLPVKFNILRPDAWMNVRELVELSEFQWFNWWPFSVLIGLICLNITVATLRRIPLNVVNLGVWMIHVGLLILAASSVWYFSTKVEGDAPVARRQVLITVPGQEPAAMVATPGASTTVGDYGLSVYSITPDWELLSGDDAGKRAYKITMLVQKSGEFFLRELIAGYPQYTEDLVQSSDPNQPFARAIKVRGTKIVDEALDLSLDYSAQDWFYLMESRAIYLREYGTTEWVQRPINRMPLFGDHIASAENVWSDGYLPSFDPIQVEVPPAEEGDPLPDVTFTITEYLRYAFNQSRRLSGGDSLSPSTTLFFRNTDGQVEKCELQAFDPAHNTALNGALFFGWAQDEETHDRVLAMGPSVLNIRVPGQAFEAQIPIPTPSRGDPAFPFTPIGSTDYSIRVLSIENLADIGQLIRMEVKKQGRDGVLSRWVFSDANKTREAVDEEAAMSTPGGSLVETGLEIDYVPGQMSQIVLLAGPEPGRLNLYVPGETEYANYGMIVGAPTEIAPGLTVEVAEFHANSRTETRPASVPIGQRERNVGMLASQARINIKTGESTVFAEWLPFHQYAFARREEVLRRFRYQPSRLQMADGRLIEIMFSRERQRLPFPVALDSFELDTHIGGFSGEVSSILDYVSRVSFQSDEKTWTEPTRVHMNAPVEYGGLWYFQSSWDPPDAPRMEGDPGSSGLNYTVLGVANRNGVVLQLYGCCLSVIGMLYAFYVKPMIKRRRQLAVYEKVARDKASAESSASVNEPTPSMVEKSS